MKTKPLTMHDLVKPGLPDRPAWLNAEARKVWDCLAPKLVAAEILTPLDGGIFGRYCQFTANLTRLSKFIAKNGQTYPDNRGIFHTRPEVAMIDQTARGLTQLEHALGMTHRSRRRIPVRQPQPLRLTNPGPRT